ncbi:MAG: sigma-70 family RNA polymerase sigma factor [Deltaproteobacteria bacterium]|nr:sigma-70 family RNA polymerase sigma factor [Deltaproteobacteria bacterium]MBW2422072.1 sigma-70 family RNA polymerase sigma factor [Deltaproteobacteria bacterium]
MASDLTEEIVERARSGDPDAFAALFTAHDADVLRVCRRMLGSADAASDARGEVFLRARRALDGYDPERSFRSWLLAIASHHCIDQLRRGATEQRIFADVKSEPGDLPGSGPSPLAFLLVQERHGALDRAIEALPLKYRLPLVLRYFAESDYDSIAHSLGVTRNQVGTLLFRAKRILRNLLAEEDAVPPDGAAPGPSGAREAGNAGEEEGVG